MPAYHTSATAKLSVSAVTSRVFHVRFCDIEEKQPALNRYSFLYDAEYPCTAEETADSVSLKTEKAELAVRYTEDSISVTLCRADGALLLETCNGIMYRRKGFQSAFRLEPGQRIYGLGDMTRDRIEKTGFASDIWVKNVEQYVPIPFLHSTKGWGILLNSTWRSSVDIGKSVPDELRISSTGGGFDLYFIAAEDTAEMLDEYTALTGRPAMLPVWAYGLVYVCNQDVNAHEMMEEALHFRSEGIPCDVIGLEPGWMSKYYDYSTEKKWHPDRFYIPFWAPKGPATFFGALDRTGFKLSLWLCCDYDLSIEEERCAGTKQISAASVDPDDNFEKDAHFAPRAFHSDLYTKPDECWFEHLKPFVDQGASCFKLDGADQIQEHPDRKWANGMDDEEMHNLYPLLLNRQMSSGFSEYTGRRSMIYSSGGFTGIQRFSATWAGDTGGGPKPLVSMLNHGFSGHVNTSCDMDVFTEGGIHFGFFQPWSQLCNWAYWRQPWFLTPERKALYRFYARLRYSLLPYIYSAAHRAASTGYPIMRAISLVYPEMPGGDALLHEYIFGDSMLTAAFAEKIVLPEGNWIDAWTCTAVQGGQILAEHHPDFADGPLYIRECSIIPTCTPADHIASASFPRLTLNIYPGSQKSHFELYEDDGITDSYRKGEFSVTPVDVTPVCGGWDIRIGERRGSYAGMPERREITFCLMTLRAALIHQNGQSVDCTVRNDGWCADVPEGFVSFTAETCSNGALFEVRI